MNFYSTVKAFQAAQHNLEIHQGIGGTSSDERARTNGLEIVSQLAGYPLEEILQTREPTNESLRSDEMLAHDLETTDRLETDAEASDHQASQVSK
jgi:hypothetical protein